MKVYITLRFVFALGPRKIAPVDVESKPISLETAMVGVTRIPVHVFFLSPSSVTSEKKIDVREAPAWSSPTFCATIPRASR